LNYPSGRCSLAIAISIIALIATFYQLYLQRVHNEKSLMPLVQIDLIDRKKLIDVRVQNNGIGPFIVEKLIFSKDQVTFASIQECLTLDPKTYQFIPITDLSKKVILPGNFLEIFSMNCGENDSDSQTNEVRNQLGNLRFSVEGSDIYNNKIVVERDLAWFKKQIIS